jgi:glycolate oxidase FAD binding subunit
MPVRDTSSLAETAAGHWTGPAVRAEAGIVVLEPADAAMAGDMLRWADSERIAIVPRGGGTKLPGVTNINASVILSTARLTTGLDHCAGDLTAVLPAGATLASVNATLGRERQWLTLDPARASRATIGGIVATNDSGPRRHRFGAPRDLIIGIEMVLVDGRKAKAGGRVVKNVAGYDLSRLMCGSFGSVALITSATFKLSPVAQASRTVVIPVPALPVLADLLRDITDAPITPSACEIDGPPMRLLVRFDSTDLSAEHQAAATVALAERRGASASVATVLTGETELDFWRVQESALWESQGTLIKIATLPSELPFMLEQVGRLSAAQAVAYRLGGRAALGVVFVRLSGHADTHPSIVADLRRAARQTTAPAARNASVVVLEAEAAVRSALDVWGDVGDALPIMQSIKARFDPHGTLSPGHGLLTPGTPGGL